MPAIEIELNTSLTEGGSELKLAVIRFNRPKVYNAFDVDTIRQLRDALEEVANDGTIRGLLLTGTGPAFCTGADVKELDAVATQDGPGSAGQRIQRHIGLLTRYQHASIIQIRRMAKPVVAAINGVVAGGGLPLALAADLRLATHDARFKGSYFGVGVVPDGGITYSLPRLVGMAKAQEILMLDRTLEAEEALELGLVHELSSHDELYLKSLKTLQELALKPGHAMGRLKLLLNQTFDSSLESQLEWERRYNMEPGTGPGLEEGVAAFVQKRRPDFVKAERN